MRRFHDDLIIGSASHREAVLKGTRRIKPRAFIRLAEYKIVRAAQLSIVSGVLEFRAAR
jgi:hypothetical protein